MRVALIRTENTDSGIKKRKSESGSITSEKYPTNTILLANNDLIPTLILVLYLLNNQKLVNHMVIMYTKP